MRIILDYKRRNPQASMVEASRATGYQENRVSKWASWARSTTMRDGYKGRASGGRKRDAILFMQEWAAVENVTRLDGPPNPGRIEPFRRTYLNVPTFNPYTSRTQLVGETFDYMREVFNAVEDPAIRFVGILLPTQFAKSTLMEQSIVHDFALDPNARNIIVSNNLKPHGHERVYNIQRILTDTETYPALHRDYGAWIGQDPHRPWTQSSFYIRGRTSPERSPSLQVFGIDSKTYGARAKIMHLDDIDDPDNSDDKRIRIARKVRGDLMTRPIEGGKLIYWGTRVGLNDVPSILMKDPRWHWIVHPAVLDIDTPNARSLCPEIYSLEYLLSMREAMGEEMFQTMQQNNPQSAGSAMFPTDLIDLAKAPFTLGEAPDDWPRIVSIDPASVHRAAVMTLAYHPSGKQIRILDLDAIPNAGYDNLFASLQKMVHLYHPTNCVVEESGAQFFSDYPEVERFLYSEGCHNLIRHTTGQNKHDPRVGIRLVKAMLATGRLRIPWSTTDSGLAQAAMKPLTDDLSIWTPTPGRRRYDTVMALWFAVLAIYTGMAEDNTGVPSIPDPVASRWSSGYHLDREALAAQDSDRNRTLVASLQSIMSSTGE